MGKITNGIQKIEIDSEQLGFTTEDSFQFDTQDNTADQEFRVEEMENPLYTRKTGTKLLGFTFAIADPNAAALKTLFGGDDFETTGVEIDGVSNVLLKKPVTITTEQGWVITFTSADVSSTINSALGKNSLFNVEVSVRQNGGKITFVDPTDV